MISSFTSLSDLVPARMIAASLCLHLLVLAVAVCLSSMWAAQRKVREPEVTQVRLVDAAPGVPSIERIEPEASGSQEAAEEIQVAPPVEAARQPVAEPPRESVQARSMDMPSNSIKMAKRSRAPLEVQAPPRPKKPEPEPKKKEESPSSYLENRMAALRKQVESSRNSPAASTTPGGAGGPRDGVGPIDPEMVRWFDIVRTRINARWSVGVGIKPAEKTTVIGVQMAEDGRLLDANIEETSGDELFDRSAVRAVFQAAPFPPVPPQVREKIRKAGGLALRFTPKGIQ